MGLGRVVDDVYEGISELDDVDEAALCKEVWCGIMYGKGHSRW